VTSGVVEFREVVPVGAGEFAAFVPLIVGVAHPATRTHAIRIKKMRSMHFFIGNTCFLPGNDPFLLLIFINSVNNEYSCCVLLHNEV
jgi:hypothetical protein